MRTFFITGVGSGLGRAFANAALQAGHTVIGTVRREDQRIAFEREASGRAFGRIVELTDAEGVRRAVDDAESDSHHIDVLVANAGYGHEGIIEESSMEDLLEQFQVNVFGTVATIKAVLPHMRRRRAGHIFVVSSVGGLMAFPGLGFYHGSKYAIEGIADSLRQEVAPFGILVTAIEPGGFRTDWAGRSMKRTPRSVHDYDELFDPLRTAREERSGCQVGDPRKAGLALLEILDAPEPPGHLVLGAEALGRVKRWRQDFDAELRRWTSISLSTDHRPGCTGSHE